MPHTLIHTHTHSHPAQSNHNNVMIRTQISIKQIAVHSMIWHGIATNPTAVAIGALTKGSWLYENS